MGNTVYIKSEQLIESNFELPFTSKNINKY